MANHPGDFFFRMIGFGGRGGFGRKGGRKGGKGRKEGRKGGRCMDGGVRLWLGLWSFPPFFFKRVLGKCLRAYLGHGAGGKIGCDDD